VGVSKRKWLSGTQRWWRSRNRSWWWSTVVVVVPIVLMTAAAVLVLVKLVNVTTPDARLEMIKVALAVGAGTGAALTLVLARRRQWATEHDAAERRLTELYVKAVEQLGSEQAAVRHGGLYALERVAQDNPNHRQTVVDVICAYLRAPYTLPPDKTGAPRLGVRRPLLKSPQRRAAALARHDTTTSKENHSLQEREVRLTAQRILTRHLRPSDDHDTHWPAIVLDLTGATLIDFSLAGCKIRTGTFDRAQFTATASFDHAQFTAASFNGAQFTAIASFYGAQFAFASFDRAQFTATARFDHAQFTAVASFHGTRFTAVASFNDTQFTGETWFDGAQFTFASFDRAQFTATARFDHAQFTAVASFHGTQFTEGIPEPLKPLLPTAAGDSPNQTNGDTSQPYRPAENATDQ